MKASTFFEAAALATLAMLLEAGLLFHGVAKPLGLALRHVGQTERSARSIPSFEESIVISGWRVSGS
jgi:hypothetical protein